MKTMGGWGKGDRRRPREARTEVDAKGSVVAASLGRRLAPLPQPPIRYRAAYAAVLVLFFLPPFLGCGGADGPRHYEVSGKVTYNGQDVPVGFIQFVPDAEKGNSGPAGGAEIRDGFYRTPPGKGAIGGAYRVEISGRDGVPYDSPEGRIEAGRSLFAPYVTHVELPLENTSKNFDVPTSGGNAP